MLLQYFCVMVLPHDGIYFMTCTKSFWSKTAPQQDTAIPVLYGQDGTSIPIFPPNETMIIMALKYIHRCASN